MPSVSVRWCWSNFCVRVETSNLWVVSKADHAMLRKDSIDAVILLFLVYGAITFHRTTLRRLSGRRRETLVAGGCG
jgi:hypothetical protein